MFRRFASATVLVAVAILQPLPVLAQPAPVAAAQPLEGDRYPRAETPVQIQHDGQTLPVRPIKTAATQRGREVVADRLIVRFVDGVSDAEFAAIHQKAARLGAGNARALAKVGRSYYVDVSGAASIEDAARAYRAADPRVQSVGPDQVARGQAAPNDTDYSKQWGLATIQAPQAWNRTLGSAQTKIAILDSGINSSHPDLAGKVVASKDFSFMSSGTKDVLGHGTHVAGIAAAATNNSQGVAGVGYNATVMNGKVIDDFDIATSFGVADGIYWAANNGATVINMSLGAGNSCEPNIFEDGLDIGVEELRDAINYAWNRNIVLVAGAGNDGDTGKRWPAACPNVLSVAATNQDDTRLNVSSFGTWVDLAAPGTAIWSTAVPNADKCQTEIAGAYAKCTGTSMAAPHVAGLAALVQKSCAPITAQGVVNRITSTAVRVPGTGTLWQYGRINALNAVCWPKPVNLHVVQQQTNSIRVGWTDMTPGGMRFDIKYRVSGSDTWLTEQGAASDTVAFIGGLTPGTSYDFKVQECDIGNVCSEFSNQVTAKALDLFKLSVSIGAGAGKVTAPGINCGNGSTDCSEFYAPGTLVTVKPTIVAGYVFDHWEGSCSGSGPCTITMSAARTVKAFFVPNTEPGPPPCPPTLPNCQEQ